VARATLHHAICQRQAAARHRAAALLEIQIRDGPVTIGGAFLLFGGWYVLSAREWFKGPVRMGTDEELERLEAEQERKFSLPADTTYQSA